MKDYTIHHNFLAKEDFVKNYNEVDEAVITFDTSIRKNIPIPNTKENKEKLQAKMIKQTKRIDEIYNEFKENRKFYGNVALFSLAGAAVLASPITPYNSVINGITVVVGSFGTTVAASSISNLVLERDAKKTKYFVDNFTEGFSGTIRVNPSVIVGLSKKLQKKLENEETYTLDINSIDIDKWSLKDLRTLKQNLDAIKWLDLDVEKPVYTDFLDESKELDEPTQKSL